MKSYGEKMKNIPSELKLARYIKLGSAKENTTDACLKAGEAFIHLNLSH
jgi:hypothetical protein